MDIVLNIKNVYKKYKNTQALNNINMQINRGDIYGFIGENGAGKSTLIRLITGVNQVTSGEITVNVSKRLGSIAAIVETPALHNSLNALDNLKVQATLLGISRSSEELSMILQLVGLGDQTGSKKQVKNFSLGMKQRLSIGMALIGDPEFILLDEPMNGLDPVGIKDMRDLILRLNHEKGTTFLISSHILTELDRVATHYGFISHGVLVEEISAQALHAKGKSLTRISLEYPLDDKAKELLSKFTYVIVNEKEITIADEKEGQKAFNLFLSADISVSNYTVERETIEDYYLKVINKGVRA